MTGAFTVGFPLGLGADADGFHPVFRMGIVAQGVSAQHRFLIDADACRGSSGSPVFLTTSGKFAGIVSSWVADTIEIKDASNQKAATIPFAIGLTECISASAIREVLDER